MMRLRVAVLTLVGVAGCLFPSLDGLVGALDASTDVAIDVTMDVATDGGEAGVAPLASDGFEQGCGVWVAQNGAIQTATAFHGGSNACMACKDSNGSYFTIDHGSNAFAPVEAGRTYTSTVWVRVAPQTTNASLTAVSVLRTNDTSGYPQQGPFVTAPVDQTWQRIATTITVDAGLSLTGYVGLENYATGDCFIIDDYALFEGDAAP